MSCSILFAENELAEEELPAEDLAAEGPAAGLPQPLAARAASGWIQED
ncbi:hypothetical protein L5D93_13055 [Paenibacillus thiaminolyticus]|nr:hypothetical protein [Paenibacillus thiaminolyticus]